MTEKRPEMPGSGRMYQQPKMVVAQVKTGTIGHRYDRPFRNPLEAVSHRTVNQIKLAAPATTQ